MDYKFQKGVAYFATPTNPGHKKTVVICIGRYGHTATFMRVGKFKLEDVSIIENRETSIIHNLDGIDYFVSSAVDVDMEVASSVLEAIK